MKEDDEQPSKYLPVGDAEASYPPSFVGSETSKTLVGNADVTDGPASQSTLLNDHLFLSYIFISLIFAIWTGSLTIIGFIRGDTAVRISLGSIAFAAVTTLPQHIITVFAAILPNWHFAKRWFIILTLSIWGILGNMIVWISWMTAAVVAITFSVLTKNWILIMVSAIAGLQVFVYGAFYVTLNTECVRLGILHPQDDDD